MNLKTVTKAEVIEMVRTQDTVLAYEKMNPSIGGKFTADGRKEIRLMEVDGKLTGVIFSPEVRHFDLSNFDGVFSIAQEASV